MNPDFRKYLNPNKCFVKLLKKNTSSALVFLRLMSLQPLYYCRSSYRYYYNDFSGVRANGRPRTYELSSLRVCFTMSHYQLYAYTYRGVM